MQYRLLSFLALLLCWQLVASTDYVRLCTLEASEIIPVTYHRYTGRYYVVNDYEGLNTTNTDGSNGRHLRSPSQDRVSEAIFVSTHRRIQSGQVTEQVLYVRQCMCTHRAEDEKFAAYCPLDKNTCGVPKSGAEPVGCFNQTSRTSLIRNAWPIIFFWYGALLLYLTFTTQGQNARHFVIGKCCKRNLNEHLMEQYWYVEGGFWRRRRRGIRGRQLSTNLDHLVDTGEQVPIQMKLKTKRYVAPKVPVDEEDDAACTICFSPLEEGDRVGALQCNHCFHVDCLKEWLPRRNTCPLCQAPDVATFHRASRSCDEDKAEPEEEGEEEQGR